MKIGGYKMKYVLCHEHIKKYLCDETYSITLRLCNSSNKRYWFRLDEKNSVIDLVYSPKEWKPTN